MFKNDLFHSFRRVMHICIGNLITMGSDNGLSPSWRQAIIWTNTGILLIGPLGTNFNEIVIKIQTFSLNYRLQNGGHLVSASVCWHYSCIFINIDMFYSTYRYSYIQKTINDISSSRGKWVKRNKLLTCRCRLPPGPQLQGTPTLWRHRVFPMEFWLAPCKARVPSRSSVETKPHHL